MKTHRRQGGKRSQRRSAEVKEIGFQHEGPYEPERKYHLVILVMILLTIAVLIGINLNSTMRSVAMEKPTVVLEQETATATPPFAPESHFPISLEERDLVERIVAAEARGEPQRAKDAVAQTVLDRSTHWGCSIAEVCTTTKQYASPYKGEISQEVKQAVVNVFDYGFRVYEEPTFMLHDTSVTPYWADEHVFRGRIGKLVFYGGKVCDEN